MMRFIVLLSQKNSSFVEAVSHKYILPSELSKKVALLRSEGKTIATLNGSFDLMHAGHLEMIYQASMQCDVLIVALNSDASIRKYKSPLRPIIQLENRLKMMAALEMVDYVTWFEQTDPIALLEVIRPDVHINGSEYGQDCIEADTVRRYGGRVHIVPLLEGLSTSSIIAKIRETCA